MCPLAIQIDYQPRAALKLLQVKSLFNAPAANLHTRLPFQHLFCQPQL
jgi:hypothetical protein